MGKRIKSSLDNRAMTLVEVIITIAVLTIMLIAVLALTNVSLKGIFTAGDLKKASAKVSEKSDHIYALIIGAEDVAQATAALNAEPGFVAGNQYLDHSSREPQFYYTRTAYIADGVRSEGFDVVVVCYYGSEVPVKKVEMVTFVLKMSEDG